MQVFALINLPTDEPFWIRRSTFLAHFDQNDFNASREVEIVAHAYRKDWFCRRSEQLEFILPVVSYVGDKTQFINGRHRIAVLINYLSELPIALAGVPLSPHQVSLRAAIPKRCLDRTVPFELPDLPFFADSGEIQEY